MVPTVTLLVVTLVAATWGEAQQRNWTPHAILYLKGARDRSVLRRTSRVEGNPLHIVTRDQSIDGPGASLSSLLLELLQRVAEKGGGNPDNYHDEQQLNLKYV